MIGPILAKHHSKILRLNQTFVHWLSPLNETELKALLSVATYTKQINNAEGVLIGYPHDVDYDDKNLAWLRPRFDSFHYIDRVIIDDRARGQQLAHKLYQDFEEEARHLGLSRLVYEVNIKPDNPRSHAFHLKQGFHALEDVEYPEWNAALRYYEKPLLPLN
jgi:predicted GNAT superfamily acetyltransferase